VTHDLADELRQVAETAARAGGQELLQWRGRFQTRQKNVCDFVTDADLASQLAIQNVIAAAFPDHTFIGEEQPPEIFASRDDQFSWIVDPLDGTTNYVHNYPCYAVSVAVARGRELLAGAIFDPVANTMYAASAGKGAWGNGSRLAVSEVARAGDALVAVSLPARVDRNSPDLLDFIEATQSCQGVRRSGSAALNLASVASGSIDAFWASHIHPWDVAAGVLLVRESGGMVTGRRGEEFDLWKPHFLATAGEALHRNLLSVLTRHPRA
jgi:myo-inositol-1(or 4)-monophosphatase